MEDPWMRIAVLSSEAGSSMAFIEMLYSHQRFSGAPADAQAAFVKTFFEIVSKRNTPGEVDQLLTMIPALQEEAPTTNSSP